MKRLPQTALHFCIDIPLTTIVSFITGDLKRYSKFCNPQKPMYFILTIYTI